MRASYGTEWDSSAAGKIDFTSTCEHLCCIWPRFARFQVRPSMGADVSRAALARLATPQMPAKMDDMFRLVLASASPRRRELLAQAGYVFDVSPAHIPEELREGEDPVAYVTRLAREKAEAVYRQQSPRHSSASLRAGSGMERPGTGGLIVLGADTTVTLDGHILEKPRDAEDAARMLRMLSGRTHRVITGVATASAAGTAVAAEVTAVRFVTLNEPEIIEYIATGEPMDKAGAYGIQGRAAKWIPRVEGCYFNVVGLPLALVTSMLEGTESG